MKGFEAPDFYDLAPLLTPEELDEAVKLNVDLRPPGQ